MYHLMMGCVPDAEGGHQIFCGSRIKKGVSSAISEYKTLGNSDGRSLKEFGSLFEGINVRIKDSFL